MRKIIVIARVPKTKRIIIGGRRCYKQVTHYVGFSSPMTVKVRPDRFQGNELPP
jgi:hypothetical protein